jgi:outer membrane protein OmpA-like peptidoglycan-associated protein
VGAGGWHWDHTGDGNHWNVVAEAGIGARYFVSENMALRADVRVPVTFNDTETHFQGSLGLSWLFGKAAPAPKAEAPAPAPAPAPAAPPPPSVGMNVNPDSVLAGHLTELCWKSTNATEAAIDGIGPVDPNACKTLSPKEDTTYHIVVKGPGGQAEATARLRVHPVPPPSITLTVEPASITAGATTKLCWQTLGATEVTIDGIGSVDPNACKQVSPAQTTTYRGVAKNAGGATEGTTTATVTQPAPPPPPPAAPTASISANPASIQAGQSTQLCWQTANATSASIDGMGAVELTGCKSVAPTQTVSYRVVAAGAGGQAEAATTVTVTQPPPPPPAAPVVKKVSMRIEIEFDTAKWDIKPKYDAELTRAAEFLKKYPGTQVTIEGHTDNVGTAEYNKKLSQERADAVRKALVTKYGIEEKRLTAKGFGFDRPVADNKTPEGRQKNRRIEAAVDTEVIVK